MDNSIDYFSIQKKFILICGISFAENPSRLFRFYTYLVFILEALAICLTLIEIFYQIHNLNNLIKPAIFMTGISIGLTKCIVLYLDRVRLGKAMNSLQKGVFAPNVERGGDLEQKWLEECIKFGRQLTIVSGSSGFITVSTIVVYCYVKKISNSDYSKWDLPYGKSSILDTSSSPNYELALIFEAYTLYMGAFMYQFTDLLFTNILAHIAIQCKILNNNIKLFAVKSFKKMVKENDLMEYNSGGNIDPTSIPWKYLKNTLIEIVSYHSALIDISGYFESVIGIAMLIEHLGVLIVLCFVMYEGSLFPFSDPRFLQNLFIACAVLTQVCALGYYGTKVTSESELVARSCYEADFIGTDVRFQKGWALIMQRSQRPITFTVYRFTPLAITTSLSMIKAAVSYFMVLRSMAKDQ